MGPVEEAQKQTLMELVNALRPFAKDGCAAPADIDEAKRVVNKWDYAFKLWEWKAQQTEKDCDEAKKNGFLHDQAVQGS